MPEASGTQPEAASPNDSSVSGPKVKLSVSSLTVRSPVGVPPGAPERDEDAPPDPEATPDTPATPDVVEGNDPPDGEEVRDAVGGTGVSGVSGVSGSPKAPADRAGRSPKASPDLAGRSPKAPVPEPVVRSPKAPVSEDDGRSPKAPVSEPAGLSPNAPPPEVDGARSPNVPPPENGGVRSPNAPLPEGDGSRSPNAPGEEGRSPKAPPAGGGEPGREVSGRSPTVGDDEGSARVPARESGSPGAVIGAENAPRLSSPPDGAGGGGSPSLPHLSMPSAADRRSAASPLAALARSPVSSGCVVPCSGSPAARNSGDDDAGVSVGTIAQGSLGYGETTESSMVTVTGTGASSFSLIASSQASCSSRE